MTTDCTRHVQNNEDKMFQFSLLQILNACVSPGNTHNIDGCAVVDCCRRSERVWHVCVQTS